MTKSIRILFIALLPVFLTACSTIKESVSDFMAGDEEESGIAKLVKIDHPLVIKKVWSASVGDGADGYYLKLTPAAGNGLIFAADRDGDVVALEMETGRRHWKTDTGKRLSGGPGYGQGLVLVGSRDGEVIALSDEDGEMLWTAEISSEVLAAPKADLGVVVARTVDGKVYGLDASSGQRLWVYERAVPLLTLRGTSSPQLARGLAIIGFDGGILCALDITDGSLIWERRISLPTGRTTLDRVVDIDADPIIMDGVIYVVTYQGRLAVVELDSGKIGWVRDLSSHAGIGVDDDHVYLTDEESALWALDRYTGNSVWKQDQLMGRSLTAPVSIGDYVVIGDFEGYLHWLNRKDGSLAGRVRLDRSAILATPFVINDILFAYSSDGALAGYKVQ